MLDRFQVDDTIARAQSRGFRYTEEPLGSPGRPYAWKVSLSLGAAAFTATLALRDEARARVAHFYVLSEDALPIADPVLCGETLDTTAATHDPVRRHMEDPYGSFGTFDRVRAFRKEETIDRG